MLTLNLLTYKDRMAQHIVFSIHIRFGSPIKRHNSSLLNFDLDVFTVELQQDDQIQYGHGHTLKRHKHKAECDVYNVCYIHIILFKVEII